MNQLVARPVSSRATHVLAIATVVAALPLVLLGAEVTTKGVGMVDHVSVRSPWYFAVEWMNDHGLGWLIEHGHRQMGWIVGLLAIATAAGEWPQLSFTPRTFSALAYLIVAGSIVAFAAYSYALRHLPVSIVSMYTYVNPIIAVALGTLLLGEPFRLSMLFAVAVILAGVALVRR